MPIEPACGTNKKAERKPKLDILENLTYRKVIHHEPKYNQSNGVVQVQAMKS